MALAVPTRDLLEAAFEQAFNAIVITDADRANGGPRIVLCNDAFCEMTGYPREELIGESPRILQGPLTDPAVIDELRNCLDEERPFAGSTINYRKDRQPYIVQWNITPVREAGEVVAYVSVQQDITERVRAEQQRDLFVQVARATPSPMMITDSAHTITFVNPAFSELTGYAAPEVAGRTPRLLFGDDMGAEEFGELLTTMEAGHPVKLRRPFRRKDGSTFIADHRVVALRTSGEGLGRYVSTFSDVTDFVARAQVLEEMASTDALTGALNRRGGDAVLEAAMRSAADSGAPLTVVLCDLDHFKQVNDTHGHVVGDRVLRGLARVMRQEMRGDDSLVRAGGEEFLVVLPGAPIAGGLALAERIRSAAEVAPDPDAGVVTVSAGVAQWDGQESVLALVERVDQALYAAKAAGRNRVST